LLAELDAHRAFASAQAGFRGMNITRSANPEGDVLVVVETRWANNNALADYATGQQNAESIFNAHSGDLVADSLQVHADRCRATACRNRVTGARL
jgi:heme-degrading monooxygenase HmoA